MEAKRRNRSQVEMQQEYDGAHGGHLQKTVRENREWEGTGRRWISMGSKETGAVLE
jgi:hypothetical protein